MHRVHVLLLLLTALDPFPARAATYLVTTNASAGAGSLRDAIAQANANPGPDTINFAIPGPNPQTIADGGLVITESVLIDGYTQSGASENTNAADLSFNGTIAVQIDATGLGSAPIVDVPTGSDVEIRGLALLGSASSAVSLRGAGGHQVAGCYIGANSSGLSYSVTANAGGGVFVDADDCTVGGTNPADRNVIVGNGQYQVRLIGNNCFVRGNIIGLRPDGSSLPATSYLSAGVDVDGSGHIIGGAIVGARNCIAAQGLAGLVITGNSHALRRNYIGTDVTGTLARGNYKGIRVNIGAGIVIGGLFNGGRNLICASTAMGIEVDSPVPGTIIRQNSIGVGVGGVALGNGGEGIYTLAAGTIVGGTHPLAPNDIRHNNSAGIATSNGIAVSIRRNSITDNIGLGIDLGQDQLNTDYPTITNTAWTPDLLIEGSYPTSPGASAVFEFFWSTTCNPSGNGGGRDYFHTETVTADGAGNADFSFTLPAATPIDWFLTATATVDEATSEFSPCVFVIDPSVVTTTAATGLGSLADAIEIANWAAGPDTIRFDIPGVGPHVIAPSQPLLINGTTLVDGWTQPGASPNTNPMDQPDNADLRVEVFGRVGLTGNGSHLRGMSFVPNPLFGEAAVVFDGAGGHTISGCRVDVHADGSCPAGVDLHSYAMEVFSDDNTVGGLTPMDRNLIRSTLLGGGDNLVQGNFFGVGPDGSTPCPAVERLLVYGSGNEIGGSTPSARNVISGATESGIQFAGGGNRAYGNFIGTDLTGTAPVPNLFGIQGRTAESHWLVGSDDPAHANLIAFNSDAGVRMTRDLGVGGGNVGINEIRDNGGLGIDLAGSGPADPPNVGGDGWTDRPVLSQAQTDASSTRIVGSVVGDPSAPARIYFYDSEGCDPSGYGEGQTFLGATNLVTEPDGTAEFDITVPAHAQFGHVTATMSADQGLLGPMTSEFSQCVDVESVVDAPVAEHWPQAYRLFPSAPNPFRRTTTIALNIPVDGGQLHIAVYDARGRRVRTLINGTLPPGRQFLSWDGRDSHGRSVSAGVYFYRLEAAGTVQTQRVVMVR